MNEHVRPAGTCAPPSLMSARLMQLSATRRGDRAFVMLGEQNIEQESLTFGELDRLARAYGAQLRRHAQPGARAMLLFPSCLGFVVGFFACHYAGLIPVPIPGPRGGRLRDSALGIAEDCHATVTLSLPVHCEIIERALAALQRPMVHVAIDAVWPPPAVEDFRPYVADPEELAFIQYTSGSTSAPKGVLVSHGNLAANLAMMTAAFDADSRTTYVGWAPLYHDMGLIANVLEPFYLGALCVLMTPAAFAQRPWLWLKAISDYRAHVSGGPNSAYDLCVERRDRVLDAAIDLRSWRLSFNSAEPVRADTLARFTEAFAGVGYRAEAMCPCYGMAEATLLVSASRPGAGAKVLDVSKKALAANKIQAPRNAVDAHRLVGSGRALAGETVRIVHYSSLRPLAEGEVGEILVAGPHIPRRYWNKPDASQRTFHVTLPRDDRRYLRTGDLGFLLDGELYITGRSKDLIIVRGRNLYPQDLERVAERAFAGLRRNSGAAFSGGFDAASGEAVVLVQEVERSSRRSIDVAACMNAIRKAVYDEFEVTLHHVVLVEPGSLPRTSSGKIQHTEARRRFLAHEFKRLTPAPSEPELFPAPQRPEWQRAGNTEGLAKW
jgi:acyl-CoA synthetase (AMP-forming)/AMP-acid ligase II